MKKLKSIYTSYRILARMDNGLTCKNLEYIVSVKSDKELTEQKNYLKDNGYHTIVCYKLPY